MVRSQHPGWAPKKIMAEAKKGWEAAALEWMVQTLETCKRKRPRAKWGYFGYPDGHQIALWQTPIFDGDTPTSTTHIHACVNGSGGPQCAYDDPQEGHRMQAENDKLAPLFAASTGLFPGACAWQTALRIVAVAVADPVLSAVSQTCALPGAKARRRRRAISATTPPSCKQQRRLFLSFRAFDFSSNRLRAALL